jgi:hypothetical protein
MTRLIKLLVSTFLILNSLGCAMRSQSTLPGSVDSIPGIENQDEVRANDYVRVTMTNGAIVHGKVIDVTHEHLVLAENAIGEAEFTIVQAIDIEQIEVDHRKGGVWVALLVVTFISILAIQSSGFGL